MHEDRFAGRSIHNDLRYGGKVLFHFVPAQHGLGMNQIDPVKLMPILKKNRALENIFDIWKLSFEGLRAIAQSPHGSSYTQQGHMLVSRDGTAELILGCYLTTIGKEGILHSRYEEDIVAIARGLLQAYKEHQIQPPFFAFLTIHSFAGNKLYCRRQEPSRQPYGVISRDPMMIPPVVIQDFNADIPTIFKDLFDPIWNECGEASSWNYDEQGRWRDSIYDRH